MPTTALTACWTGPFGSIPEMEVERIRGLNDAGINLSPLSPLSTDCILTSIEPLYSGFPMIYKGVILTARIDKDTVLAQVWEQNNWKYSKIIFIDDLMENIERVGAFAQQIGVKYQGIHYTQASRESLPELSLELEEKRFAILESEGLWLTDEALLKFDIISEGL